MVIAPSVALLCPRLLIWDRSSPPPRHETPICRSVNFQTGWFLAVCLPPSLLPSISLYPPLFALLMAFGCNCTCFVFTRLQLLIAHKLKQSHKKWKVIFGTLKVNSIHSRHPSSLQFILLSLTEHSIADGSFPIDSEATDQENYFKQFSPVPSPQHWPL